MTRASHLHVKNISQVSLFKCYVCVWTLSSFSDRRFYTPGSVPLSCAIDFGDPLLQVLVEAPHKTLATRSHGRAAAARPAPSEHCWPSLATSANIRTFLQPRDLQVNEAEGRNPDHRQLREGLGPSLTHLAISPSPRVHSGTVVGREA